MIEQHIRHETGRKALEMQARTAKPGRKPTIIAIGEIAFSHVYSMGDGVPQRALPFILEEWDAKHGMWVGAKFQPTTLKGAQQFTSRWPKRFKISSAKNPLPDTDLHKMQCLTVGEFKARGL